MTPFPFLLCCKRSRVSKPCNRGFEARRGWGKPAIEALVEVPARLNLMPLYITSFISSSPHLETKKVLQARVFKEIVSRENFTSLLSYHLHLILKSKSAKRSSFFEENLADENQSQASDSFGSTCHISGQFPLPLNVQLDLVQVLLVPKNQIACALSVTKQIAGRSQFQT